MAYKGKYMTRKGKGEIFAFLLNCEWDVAQLTHGLIADTLRFRARVPTYHTEKNLLGLAIKVLLPPESASGFILFK